MRVVFNKTLRNMYKPLIVSLYFIVVILFTILFAILSKGNSLSILEQIERVKSTYISFNFLYLSGIGLVFLMMIFGLDIFGTEEYEGTMRILVAKPISRSSIVLGKIFGILFGTFLYYIFSLIISMTLYFLILMLDRDVLIGVLNLIPSFILYSIFIIFVLVGITSLLSSLFKKKTPSIIILVVLVITLYGVFPITRNLLNESGKYEAFKLQRIDINAQLGNVYMSIIERGKEENEVYSQPIIMFTGRYILNNKDPDLYRNFGSVQVHKNNLINTPIISLIYIIVSFIMFYFSYRIMIKKDITWVAFKKQLCYNFFAWGISSAG